MAPGSSRHPLEGQPNSPATSTCSRLRTRRPVSSAPGALAGSLEDTADHRLSLRHNLGYQRHAKGIQGRLHYFHLGQVGPVILAVPKLEQAIFRDRDIATGSGAVHSHHVCLQVVYAHRPLVHFHLKRRPVLIVSQSIQNTFQPIIAEIQPANHLTETFWHRCGFLSIQGCTWFNR